MRTAHFKTRMFVCFVLCLALRVGTVAQKAPAITPNYDVTIGEKDTRFSATTAAATSQHELWLAVDVDHPKEHADKNAHLWKLDKNGKKIVDIEIRDPDHWTSDAHEGDSSIRGIVVTEQGPKAYVIYSNHSELWALQLDNSGKLLRGQKIITRFDEASGGIRFSPDMSQAIIVEGALGLSHLTKDDKMDWTIQLPLKENEGVILDAIVRDEVFVTVFREIDSKPTTLIFSYDLQGKPLEKQKLPELNQGLSTIEGQVRLFQVSTTNDAVSVALLDPKTLQLVKQIPLPELHNFVVPLKTEESKTALIVSRKDASDIGLLVLDQSHKPQLYHPLELGFYPAYLMTTVLGRIFFADDTRIFMLAPEKAPGTIRVISFSLPVS